MGCLCALALASACTETASQRLGELDAAVLPDAHVPATPDASLHAPEPQDASSLEESDSFVQPLADAEVADPLPCPEGAECSDGGIVDGERCDGQDDDGDGRVDEGYTDLLGPCTRRAGGCITEGTFECTVEGWRVCNAPEPSPQPEICNGQDDDCDGITDEGQQVVLNQMSCTQGVGRCLSEGVLWCDPSGQVSCRAPDIEPRDELCDHVDDDCDGLVDEGYAVGEPCIAGYGICQTEGEGRCADNGRGVRCFAVSDDRPSPQMELCNGLDDDCDGQLDEDFGLDRTCTIGLGPCSVSGGYVCSPDQRSGVCSVTPSDIPQDPEPETCNDIDDDCDGVTDEGEDGDLLVEPCYDGPPETEGVGVCRGGNSLCFEGEPGLCDGQVLPGEELCNGLDDDCDGALDEACEADLEPALEGE
ncbi:MAG: MopE-related protein [Bradymonadia bacterium]